uniref:Secreted protein n=1 Tax=Haemonchus contortus TaxID=6289 RepID=A0A7I4Z1M5_HAECO
ISEASLLMTMSPTKTLAAVLFMLQVSQSPSCTFTNVCRVVTVTNVTYEISSASRTIA